MLNSIGNGEGKAVKIAMILTNGFDPDPRVYKEAKTLTELGHQIEILCWDRAGLYFDKPEENIDGIKIVRFFGNTKYGTGYKQIWKFLDFKQFVLKYIKENSFHVIHCHDFDGLIIGKSAARNLNLKLVYDQHDIFSLYFSNRKGIINKILARLIRFTEKRLLRKVDVHIVVTPKMKEFYNASSKNIVVVTNAPDKSFFSITKKSPSSTLRIGFIGSVRYAKEIKSLIDASQEFSDKVEVIISGAGIHLEELKDYAKPLENVKITGPFNHRQLEELYQNIDVTYAFYPSFASEISMPNKFFESIITKTPVIANKNSEFGQEVESNGFGFSIPGKNLQKELKEVISLLLNSQNLKHEIQQRMELLENNYFWQANKEKLKKIYGEY
jgi:glycosyltransferase involved in cell wall biosynthesis